MERSVAIILAREGDSSQKHTQTLEEAAEMIKIETLREMFILHERD